MDMRKVMPGRALWAGIAAAASLAAALAGCASSGTATAAGTPAAAPPASTLSAPATSAAPSVTPVSALQAAGASLPISVQSDTAMRSAGNAGPSSSILVPSSCHLSGASVTAAGTYQGSFVPAVYARYGDVIDLYVFTASASGYSSGIQLGELSLAHPPALGGARTWTVTVPVDTSLGTPHRCLVAAQPTHDFEGAPSAY